jgi:hypothetical protein
MSTDLTHQLVYVTLDSMKKTTHVKNVATNVSLAAV